MEKIDQILDSLYDRVIEPMEAKQQLLDLFAVINWLAFADVQPKHEQPIVYWRGGYKLGKWNNETKTMWDGSSKPKVWYPLPTCL